MEGENHIGPQPRVYIYVYIQIRNADVEKYLSSGKRTPY